jgi:DNA repair exonuclease SbcCD ATPase subunit
LIEAAVERSRRLSVDGVLLVGGGSAPEGMEEAIEDSFPKLNPIKVESARLVIPNGCAVIAERLHRREHFKDVWNGVGIAQYSVGPCPVLAKEIGLEEGLTRWHELISAATPLLIRKRFLLATIVGRQPRAYAVLSCSHRTKWSSASKSISISKETSAQSSKRNEAAKAESEENLAAKTYENEGLKADKAQLEEKVEELEAEKAQLEQNLEDVTQQKEALGQKLQDAEKNLEEKGNENGGLKLERGQLEDELQDVQAAKANVDQSLKELEAEMKKADQKITHLLKEKTRSNRTSRDPCPERSPRAKFGRDDDRKRGTSSAKQPTARGLEGGESSEGEESRSRKED